MLRSLCALIVLLAVSAHAQRGPKVGKPEPLPVLKVDGTGGSHGPDGNAAYSGELLEPFCFKTPAFCATPGMKLSLWTQYGVLRALQKIESPKPFMLFGVRFAANAPVELGLGGNSTARGTLEEPLEVDGRLVKGRVDLVFEKGKLLHAQVGTLASEAVIEGWKVPAGYAFDLQNLASGSMLLTGFAGAPPLTWVGEARPGIPTKATGVTQWRDAMGAMNLQLELPATETLEGLSFGPGQVIFMWAGEVRAVRGVVSAPFTRGAVKAPKGTYVVLCGGVLQTVKTEEPEVRVGRFVTSKLDAMRERSPRGWRNDLYGQPVIDHCSEGAAFGYTFLPQYCPGCTGAEKVPSLVVVDLQGDPRDDESRAMLDTFPSLKKPNCPPCR